jgi:hypothetical protein
MAGVFINTYVGEPQTRAFSGLLACKLMLISSGTPELELTNSLRERLSFGRRTFSDPPPTDAEDILELDEQLCKGVELLDEVFQYRWKYGDEALIKGYVESLQLCYWYRRLPQDRLRKYASIQWTI